MFEEIHKRVYVGDKVPVGVLLANVYDETIYIAWSKCHVCDKFDHQLGLSISENRIEAAIDPDGRVSKVKAPIVIRRDIERFIERCRKYYKLDAVKLIGDFDSPIAREHKEPIGAM